MQGERCIPDEGLCSACSVHLSAQAGSAETADRKIAGQRRIRFTRVLCYCRDLEKIRMERNKNQVRTRRSEVKTMGIPKIQSQERELTLSEAIAERRSTPSFDGSPVLGEVLKTILWSGIEAPSSFNLQPWRFIVVRDASTEASLARGCNGSVEGGRCGRDHRVLRRS